MVEHLPVSMQALQLAEQTQVCPILRQKIIQSLGGLASITQLTLHVIVYLPFHVRA